MKVNLQTIAENAELNDGDVNIYLDKETGELITITHDEIRDAEDEKPIDHLQDWERKNREWADLFVWDEDGRFVELPTPRDLDEYRVMESFAHSLEDEEKGNKLLRAIRGRGAFRRFKDMVGDLGLEEDWYAYKEAQFLKVAKRWCEDEEIPYES
ncbi:hypothetical protein N780_17620 [Pontibacillus chungwhensis BH030062]|uniref:Uncharacterized protein n=1 Tax=Pontibacillus chungwhensis BH030062 TaxID=1385513 RepID=A0A0A2UWJ2_9BACI|nr:UPF0158 family protein [Pontibacillus chungwhensis]KGP91148.1 hypothetical protein N780_17620 [Pontibacillus chungwhensis BH030062]